MDVKVLELIDQLGLTPDYGGDADQHTAVLLDAVQMWLEEVSSMRDLPPSVQKAIDLRLNVKAVSSDLQKVEDEVARKEAGSQKAAAATVAKIMEQAEAMSESQREQLKLETQQKLETWAAGKIASLRAQRVKLAEALGKNQRLLEETILSCARQKQESQAAPPEDDNLESEMMALAASPEFAKLAVASQPCPEDLAKKPTVELPHPEDLAKKPTELPRPEDLAKKPTELPHPEDLGAKKPTELPHPEGLAKKPTELPHPEDPPKKPAVELPHPEDPPKKPVVELPHPEDPPKKPHESAVPASAVEVKHEQQSSDHGNTAMDVDVPELHKSVSMRSDATTLVMTPTRTEGQAAADADESQGLRDSIMQVLQMPDSPLKDTLLRTLLRSYNKTPDSAGMAPSEAVTWLDIWINAPHLTASDPARLHCLRPPRSNLS